MTRRPRVPDALLAQIERWMQAAPVDEDAVYSAVQRLIADHGFTRAAIARALGRHGGAIFRIVASRRPELAPYQAMCGNRSSVMATLGGIPAPVREQLRQRFESTGRRYSQGQLRMVKRRLASGEAFNPAWLGTDAAEAAAGDRARERRAGFAGDRQARSDAGDDSAFLQALAEVVARANWQAPPGSDFDQSAGSGNGAAPASPRTSVCAMVAQRRALAAQRTGFLRILQIGTVKMSDKTYNASPILFSPWPVKIRHGSEPIN